MDWPGVFCGYHSVGGVVLYRALAALALLAALWGAYAWWAGVQRAIGATAERAVWAAAVDAANARADDAARAARAARDAQDLKDSRNAKITADLERKLRDAGRLRDPHAEHCAIGGAANTASTGNGSNDAAQDTGLLSANLSGLLRTLTREADALNLAYIASRSDAEQLRGLLAACGKPTP